MMYKPKKENINKIILYLKKEKINKEKINKENNKDGKSNKY